MVNEHYVPRSYLRQFAPNNADVVSRYSLVEKHGGGDYYAPIGKYPIDNSAAIDGWADGWLENDETTNTEREMIEALRSVISNTDLEAEDVGCISQFLAFQGSRTPRSMLHYESREEIAHLLDDDQDQLPNHFDEGWKNALYHNANEGHESLQFMGWRVVENESSVPFITSDDPVTHYFGLDFDEVQSVKMQMHGREIYCPLDPDTLLILLDPETFHVESQRPDTSIDRITVSDGHEVHKFNLLQGVTAFQEIFGPVGEDQYLEQIIDTLCRAYPHDDFIRGNRGSLEKLKEAQSLTGNEDVDIDEESRKEYLSLLFAQLFKSRAVWSYNHNIEITKKLSRNELQSGYWDGVISGADPRDLI